MRLRGTRSVHDEEFPPTCFPLPSPYHSSAGTILPGVFPLSGQRQASDTSGFHPSRNSSQSDEDPSVSVTWLRWGVCAYVWDGVFSTFLCDMRGRQVWVGPFRSFKDFFVGFRSGHIRPTFLLLASFLVLVDCHVVSSVVTRGTRAKQIKRMRITVTTASRV